MVAQRLEIPGARLSPCLVGPRNLLARLWRSPANIWRGTMVWEYATPTSETACGGRARLVHIGRAVSTPSRLRPGRDIGLTTDSRARGGRIGDISSRRRSRVEARGIGESGVMAILRPGVIFGPDDAFLNRLAGMARQTPVLPLFGPGGTRLQPVYVGNVAEACVRILADPSTRCRVYESRRPAVGPSPCRSAARRRTHGTTDRRSSGLRCRIPRDARRSSPWSSGSPRAGPPASSTAACRCAARSSAPAPAARCAASRSARSPPRSVGLPFTRHGLGPASAIVNRRSACST